MLNELIDSMGYVDEVGNLPNRLIYGSYPAVITAPGDAQEIVSGLASDNLYKDVLNLGDIIKTDKLEKILRVLALQITIFYRQYIFCWRDAFSSGGNVLWGGILRDFWEIF